MSTVTIVLLVILVILIAAVIALYFFGKKAQKKQDEQQAQIQANKQTVSMLIIDKKRMPLQDSGLPQMVIDQTPKLMRRSKLPIVKAKVGPKISILIADEKVFDLIPVKKEIKAEVSGLYIVGVKGIRGSLETPQKKKKGFLSRFRKYSEYKATAVVSGIFPDTRRLFFIRQNPYSLWAVPGSPGNSLPHVPHSYPARNLLSSEDSLHSP